MSRPWLWDQVAKYTNDGSACDRYVAAMTTVETTAAPAAITATRARATPRLSSSTRRGGQSR